jgi:hypothetical protein
MGITSLFFIFKLVVDNFNRRLILTSFSFVQAKVVTGFDTKERKSQGCFIFLTPKLQKIAKPKKLAFVISSSQLALVPLRSYLLDFNFELARTVFAS